MIFGHDAEARRYALLAELTLSLFLFGIVFYFSKDGLPEDRFFRWIKYSLTATLVALLIAAFLRPILKDLPFDSCNEYVEVGRYGEMICID